jgi:hypothetical protein
MDSRQRRLWSVKELHAHAAQEGSFRIDLNAACLNLFSLLRWYRCISLRWLREIPAPARPAAGDAFGRASGVIARRSTSESPRADRTLGSLTIVRPGLPHFVDDRAGSTSA